MTQHVRIPGRHIATAAGGWLWSWPGTYAEFSFNGNGFIAQVEGEGLVLRITVDGEAKEFGPLPSGQQQLAWATSAPGLHAARIQSISEEAATVFHLRSVSCVGEGSGIVPLEAKRPYLVEFVGDSWTCGYANLSADALISDCTRAFAALTADLLGWDYSLVAFSGRGIAKNYGDTPPSLETIPAIYGRGLSSETQSLAWLGRKADFSVVLAGENDFSDKPWPTEALFVQQYRSLLSQIRSRHPGVELLVVGVDRPHPAAALAEQVVATEKADGAQDIAYLHMPNLDPRHPLGFNFHPGLEHHQAMAQVLHAYFSMSHRTAVTPRG